MLVSTEKSSIWRKVIGQTIHRRPAICSWNYKLINSDTESSIQVKTVKTKCYILSTSLSQGNTGSIKRLWRKLGVQVLLLWVWTHAVLQGTVWIRMRGKTPPAPLQAIDLQSQQSQQQLLCWRTSLLALNFLSSPSFTKQLIKPLVLSSIHTKMNPSFPVTCYILKVSWFPTSHSKGQLFPGTQTEQACRLLYHRSPSSQKLVNICTRILNSLRRTT